MHSLDARRLLRKQDADVSYTDLAQFFRPLMMTTKDEKDVDDDTKSMSWGSLNDDERKEMFEIWGKEKTAKTLLVESYIKKLKQEKR